MIITCYIIRFDSKCVCAYQTNTFVKISAIYFALHIILYLFLALRLVINARFHKNRCVCFVS